MGLIEKRLIKLGLEEWLPESIKDLREITGGQQFYEMERIGRAVRPGKAGPKGVRGAIVS